MSNFKNKNCSELLLTNGMGLDGAPVKFFTLVFLRPPNAVQYLPKIEYDMLLQSDEDYDNTAEDVELY